MIKTQININANIKIKIEIFDHFSLNDINFLSFDIIDLGGLLSYYFFGKFYIPQPQFIVIQFK